MNRTEVRNRINEIGIIPCARVSAPEHARFAAETLDSASLPILEIPLTLPQAPAVIEEIASRFPDFAVGAGTVLDTAAAQRSIAAGARFITSPGLIPEVVAAARDAGVVVFPGALTPSEIIAAWNLGVDFVKIFPAATAGGTHYVRALKVPLPHVPLVVTGGVNQMTAFDYILAGASAIGVGRELLPRESLLHRQDHRIHELARRFLIMVREARAQRDADAGSAETAGRITPRFSGD
jgi:2-dehydro-3-deoxyphosphogluconate aldolase/(4S)-4-hydroxy-2-oxoglutarate aldolase